MRHVALTFGILLTGLAAVFCAALVFAPSEDSAHLGDAVIGVILSSVPFGFGLLLIRIGRNRGPWHVLMSKRRRGKLSRLLVSGESVLCATFISAPGTRRPQIVAVLASGAVGVVSTIAMESVSGGMVVFAISLVVGEIIAFSIAPTDLGLGVLLLTNRRVLIVDRSQLSGALSSVRLDESVEGLSIFSHRDGWFPVTTLMFASGRHIEIETTRQAALLLESVAETPRRDRGGAM